jgi:hypothetical protein
MSNESSTSRLAAVAGMSCMSPWAPRRDTARGLNSDSTATIAATRRGSTRWRAATSSMWARISAVVGRGRSISRVSLASNASLAPTTSATSSA